VGQQTLTELRAGTPLRAGGVTIVPLERWHVTVGSRGRRVYVNGGKRPTAIVIVDPHGVRAVDDAGIPLELDDLRERAAGLRAALRAEERAMMKRHGVCCTDFSGGAPMA
jgi:hypothetical protein